MKDNFRSVLAVLMLFAVFSIVQTGPPILHDSNYAMEQSHTIDVVAVQNQTIANSTALTSVNEVAYHSSESLEPQLKTRGAPEPRSRSVTNQLQTRTMPTNLADRAEPAMVMLA